MIDHEPMDQRPEGGPENPAGPLPDARKPASRLRWALIASLAVNLLVLGTIGGAMLSHGRRMGPGSITDVGFGPLTEALTQDDRRALRSAFIERSPGFRDLRRETRADFGALVAALRAPAWNEAAVRAALDSQRTRTVERIALGQDLLLDRIAEMTADQRAAFADRIEQAMRRPRGAPRP